MRIRNRQGKGVNAISTERGPYSNECNSKAELELRNMKYVIDPNNQDYMTYIYDKEATIWYKDKEFGNRAIVIKDPSLVKMHRNIFDSLWQKK